MNQILKQTSARSATPSSESSEELRKALLQQAQTVERLHFLIEASKVLNSTLDLAEVIRNILDMTTRETGAERATLFLMDHEHH